MAAHTDRVRAARKGAVGMDEKTTETAAPRRSGGLYARVKMSVRSANIMVAVLIAALVIATIFVVRHNGFTVKFETDGGSQIDSVKVLHSETVPAVEDPVKEGWQFAGWYTDKELKTKYDFSSKVTKSFTLYAAWTKADNSKNEIVLIIGEKTAQVFRNNKTNDVAPKVVNNRTMLPTRFVAENLGADVSWDAEKQLVTIKGKNLKTGDDVEIHITIGAETAKVNEKEIKLDSCAFVENNRTYTPIRFICENLGADVDWIEKEQKVVITKPETK